MTGMSKPRCSAAEWRRVFRRQRASGQSVAAFCQRTGVPVSSFYVWRRRVEARRPGVPARFAEVRIACPSTATGRTCLVGSANAGGGVCDAGGGVESGIELRVADGFRVMVRRGFDQQALADLLHVLRDSALREAGA